MRRWICSCSHHASGCGKNKNHVGKGKHQTTSCRRSRRLYVVALGLVCISREAKQRDPDCCGGLSGLPHGASHGRGRVRRHCRHHGEQGVQHLTFPKASSPASCKQAGPLGGLGRNAAFRVALFSWAADRRLRVDWLASCCAAGKLEALNSDRVWP